MADFLQAIKWLARKKRVRRNNWFERSFIEQKNTFEIAWNDGSSYSILDIFRIEADDWELYVDKKDIVEFDGSLKIEISDEKLVIKMNNRGDTEFFPKDYDKLKEAIDKAITRKG